MAFHIITNPKPSRPTLRKLWPDHAPLLSRAVAQPPLPTTNVRINPSFVERGISWLLSYAKFAIPPAGTSVTGLD